MTPSWLLDSLAAIMLVIAAASAARVVTAALSAQGRWRPVQMGTDADVAHALMAIAMAGMFTPSLATLPDTAWGAVFGILTAWFTGRMALEGRRSGARGLQAGHCLPHLIHCAAMLYMFLALSAPPAGSGGMTGMNMGGPAMAALEYPTVAGAFILLLIGYGIWDLGQLPGNGFSLAIAGIPAAAATATRRNPGARAFLLAPATRLSWQVILGIAMALMLVIMI